MLLTPDGISRSCAGTCSRGFGRALFLVYFSSTEPTNTNLAGSKFATRGPEKGEIKDNVKLPLPTCLYSPSLARFCRGAESVDWSIKGLPRTMFRMRLRLLAGH